MCVQPLHSAGAGVAVVGGGDVKQNTRQPCFTDAAGLLLNDFFPNQT